MSDLREGFLAHLRRVYGYCLDCHGLGGWSTQPRHPGGERYRLVCRRCSGTGSIHPYDFDRAFYLHGAFNVDA